MFTNAAKAMELSDLKFDKVHCLTQVLRLVYRPRAQARSQDFGSEGATASSEGRNIWHRKNCRFSVDFSALRSKISACLVKYKHIQS